MDLSSIHISLVICMYCLIVYCHGASYGDNCTTVDDCTEGHQTCDSNNKCRCVVGYTVNTAGNCAGELGTACTTNDNCADPAAICSRSACSCNATSYDSNGSGSGGTCTTKITLGGACPDPGTSHVLPTDSCMDPNSECSSSNLCQCKQDFTSSNGQCVQISVIQHGDDCTTEDTCAGDSTECSGGTCQCVSGYYWNNVVCTTKVALGGTCPPGLSTSSLPCSESDAVCTNTNNEYKCLCRNGYYDTDGNTGNVGGTCNQKEALGETCPSGLSTSSLPCSDSNAVCTNTNNEYKCLCRNGYYDNDGNAGNVGGSCNQKEALGETCPSGLSTSSLPCSDSNAVCTNTNNEYKCLCRNGYYDNDGNAGNVGGTCNQKEALGETCPSGLSTSSLPCSDSNAVCTNTNNEYKCLCRNGYYDNDGNAGNVGGTCNQKEALGETCPSGLSTSSLPCSDSNAVCTNTNNEYKCLCRNGYYDNDGNAGNVGGTCNQKEALGERCPSGLSTSSLPCSDSNAVCTNTNNEYKCLCRNGYYDNDGNAGNVGGTCNQKEALGETCPSGLSTSSLPCSDSNAVCTNTNNEYKCLCRNGYYDNDGNAGNVGGTCNQKVALGETCPSVLSTLSLPCSESDAVCTNTNSEYKCLCRNGYYDTDGNAGNVGGTCYQKVALGETCPSVLSTLSLPCSESDAVCTNTNSEYKCLCRNGYYDTDGNAGNVGGTCYQKEALGETCPSGLSTSSLPCSDSNAVCTNTNNEYKCLCRNGYYDTDGNAGNVGGTCNQKEALGETCPSGLSTSSLPCSDSNAVCTNTNNEYKCLCRNGYYDNDGNTGNVGGTCNQKVALGETCPSGLSTSSLPCSESDAVCTNTNNEYKCLCRNGYYDTDGNAGNVGGTCNQKVELGNLCPMEDACLDTNSQCVSGKCACKSNYYDSNTVTNPGGTCEDRKELGALCTTTPPYNTDQCKAQSATCYNSRCACNPGYHQESTLCKANKANGEPCTGIGSGECSDPNAQCTNSKCTCGLDYYDDNGLGNGGKCEPVSQLQVGSVVFSDIQTTSVTVSWSHPPGNLEGYVNSYSVRWTLKSTVNYNQPSSLPSSTTDYTVTGITPGKAYNVVIISRNTQTESGKERNTSLTKQQAAKPNMVRGITPSGADLDVSDGNLQLAFTAANNGKSGYIVRLFDDTTKIAERTLDQSQTAVTIYNLDVNSNYRPLKNGYKYKVRIITLSESFDSVKRVESDTFEEIIKTVAKVADAPNNLQLSDVTSRSINVTWEKPSKLYSAENFGYDLQIKNDKGTCVIEMLYKCFNCNFGNFTFSQLTGTCTSITQQIEYRTKEQMEESMSYIANLDPDILYTITVTAVGGAGRGHEAIAFKTTLEEAPKTPTYVRVSNIGSNSFTVSWSIDGPRPGKTTFNIKIDANSPAMSMEKSVEGFYNRSFVVTGLQEYWNYSVSVIAKTSKGSKKSDAHSIRTMSSAPGKVTEFTVTPHQCGDYTQIRVSWKSPTILDRNGVIKGYNFVHNASMNGPTLQTVPNHELIDDVFDNILLVKPKMYYTFKVSAVNSLDQVGEELIRHVLTPAEVTSTECKCPYQSSSDMKVVIVGVVLGLVILILVVYSGFVTFKLRRFIANDGYLRHAEMIAKQQPTYMNELFQNVTPPNNDIEVLENPTSEYSTLSDETREAKSTYDIIRVQKD